MKITNSMTGKKELFIPIKEGEVKMYGCGITVYDLSHIGHARQAIVYAMITEYFKYKGYKVTYVRNYTDVDDKIIKKANERGITALELSEEQIKETEKDMKNLHVEDADIKVKASEYINPIIEFIEELIKKGNAYVTEKGDVYFSVKTFPEYGKLSHRKISDMRNGVRIELEKDKKAPVDFALWKSAKENEIYWKSPWGNGRPGWHIECSVMILKNLGETIDIHGGGRDLLFPHHENEIAQSEALTGKPLANYWNHCGLVKINGEKMSKSLGNSLTIRKALQMYNYEVIKYLMLSKHYASDIDITDESFKISENHMYYFYKTIKKMDDFIAKEKESNEKTIIKNNITETIERNFVDAMDDDFNSSLAIANLHTLFKYANSIMKTSTKNNTKVVANTLSKILNDVKKTYKVLGMFEQVPEDFINEMRIKYIEKLNIDVIKVEEKIKTRLEAKKRKEFEIADKIRNELTAIGIILEDSNNGTYWDIKI